MVINQAADNAEAVAAPVLSLIFSEGQRPDLDAIATLAAAPGAVMPFAISHIPDAEHNWVELLAGGLTFDLIGLANGLAAPFPQPGALLGLAEAPAGEALTLQPAPHLADGPGMVPVVRVLAGIGAQLASLPGVLAVQWQPANCWMTVKYYCGVIAEWLGGGAFPALGLTSLRREPDGAMSTLGLAFFIGQELRFEPDRRLPPAAIAKAAVRLVHSLVESGPLRTRTEYGGPEGIVLLVEPVRQGRLLRVTVQR